MTLLEKINKTNFKKVLRKLGYVYFTKNSFNLNIIGIRSNERDNNNIFDDYIVVEYYNSDRKVIRYVFPCTTNPGRYYLQNPTNRKGCAILVPGQYRRAYTFGLHQGKYRALVQSKAVKVYRDNNRDRTLDMNPDTIEEGFFGINIHKAGTNSNIIENWSAGCQVLKKEQDFANFMSLCYLQSNYKLGNKFTYTLIDEKDLGLD